MSSHNPRHQKNAEHGEGKPDLYDGADEKAKYQDGSGNAWNDDPDKSDDDERQSNEQHPSMIPMVEFGQIFGQLSMSRRRGAETLSIF